jgi:DNA-binding transcriptional regulator GbsR (MarR family)
MSASITVDDIKREFIHFMEEYHNQVLTSKNYAGCLMAVFVEQRPVNQDRIIELTGYSRTTVSLVLKEIQKIMPLKRVKIPGDRKRYYEYGVNTTEFMINFFQQLIEYYRNRVDFIPPVIEKLIRHDDPSFINFLEFLEKFHDLSILFFEITQETTDEFKEIFRSGKIDQETMTNSDPSKSSEIQAFMENLSKVPDPPVDFVKQKSMDGALLDTYLQIKNDYFAELKKNIDFGSLKNTARGIIGHELFIENRPITQEEIETSTGYQRSLISEVMNLLVDQEVVKVIKRRGDRKKYYYPNYSWDILMLGKFKRNIDHARIIKNKLKTLSEKNDNIKDESEEKSSLVTFLEKLSISYDLYANYFQIIQEKYLKTRISQVKKIIESTTRN